MELRLHDALPFLSFYAKALLPSGRSDRGMLTVLGALTEILGILRELQVP